MEMSAVSDGWHLSQSTYCKDLLAKWGMEACRAIGSLEDVGDEVPEEDEPTPNDVHKAHCLAGGEGARLLKPGGGAGKSH